MSEIPEFNSLFRLDGKIAVVTGGSRGIGLHAATAFLLAGCSLCIITARKPDGLSAGVDSLNALKGIKGKAIGVQADLSKPSEVERFAKEVAKIVADKNGAKGIDILVANAGATWGSSLESTPDSALQKILDLNVRGVFNLVKAFAPLLAARGTPSDPSRIIITGSTAGINIGNMGENGTIMYSASKAAAHHLGRNFAVELGPKNITTNSISPGFFPSKMADGLISALGGTDKLSEGNPRGRLGEARDIAGVVLYLAGPAGAYTNGAVIPLDGGANLTKGRDAKI